MLAVPWLKVKGDTDVSEANGPKKKKKNVIGKTA